LLGFNYPTPKQLSWVIENHLAQLVGCWVIETKQCHSGMVQK
jgi:hypothetical protein